MTASVGPKNLYPGSTLGASGTLALAETFYTGALHMLDAGWVNKPRSSAPFRLVAIHAIELYLSAYLLAAGHDQAVIRGMQHDLGKRLELARSAGLTLPLKTVEHVLELSSRREYLLSRYGAPEADTVSQTNRLKSTLDHLRRRISNEVAAKQTEKAAVGVRVEA